VKKNNTKKAKAKVASKPKPVSRKPSPALKAKSGKTAAPALTTATKQRTEPALPAKTPKKAPSLPAAVVPTKNSAGSARASATLNGKQRKGEPESKSRKNAESAARKAPPTPPEPEAPPVKTYLTAKELKDFKVLLLDKRAELAGDVERLTSEALNRKSGGVNEQSTMPIHMADLGSDTWEQDFTLGLIANEQALVREIDDALARIEDRTYGMCVATDKPISKERLRAKPWAKYCIEYARLREEGRAP